MITFPLAVGFFMGLIAVLWGFIAIALMVIILLQKGKGGGLSAAFGGGSAGGLLGTKTGDFMTKVTIGLVAVFFILSIALVKWYRPSKASGLESDKAPAGMNLTEDTTGDNTPVAPPAGDTATEQSSEEVSTDGEGSNDNPEVSNDQININYEDAAEEAIEEAGDAAGAAVDGAIEDGGAALDGLAETAAGDN